MTVTVPAGKVTFVMTDVEAPAPGRESLAIRASGELVRSEIVADATHRHKGLLPAEHSPLGRSVSAFASVFDAAACAVEIQRLLEGQARSNDTTFRVRIALHTGAAEPPPDLTSRGAALHRCARLLSIGHGGQILISQTTRDLLAGRLAADLALRDLGIHRLRDLARPERVWQLCHPELADEFPPLRSLDAVANNLPIQLTSFVGREGEIAAVSLLMGAHRLVTLTGAGGCGKTRLALEVAAAAADHYPDGIWWVDLASLADPALVPASLAAVLGVPESPLEPITDTVVRHLADRQALVVLDNCEHLIEASAALADRLLKGCPTIAVSATSRELLGVTGETTWPVPPLSLPRGTDVTSSEAVRLFVERARSCRPNFTMADTNAGAVSEICTRLDGIPLAIELAAARTRLLTVEKIAAGLAEGFELLTGGARTALPRHRTLESSVDWSHDLLDASERIVFRRLGVFAGSFTLDAAEAVCVDDVIGVSRVLELLSGLVDRSLVQVVHDAGPETRYRLLETLRDYAHRRLADAGELNATRDRHLDFYVSLAEQAAPRLDVLDLLDWLARIDAEVPNLRVALDWSVDSTSRRGLRLVGRLVLYLFARSDLEIGRQRLDGILAAPGDGPDRAHALIALCWIAYRAGAMAKARHHADEAIAIAHHIGAPAIVGAALAHRAVVRFWGEGDEEGGWADFEEADTLLRQAHDRQFRALNLGWFGQSLFDSSRAPRARAVLQEGVADTHASGAVHARGPCLVGLGLLDTFEGRFDDAEVHLDEVLPLAQATGDHYSEILARMSSALLSLFRGRYQDARDHCEPGLATAVAHRSPNGEAFMRLALGWVAYAEARLDEAATELGAAFEILAPLMPRMAATCRALAANVAVAQSRPQEADRYAKEGLALGQANDSIIAMQLAFGAHAQLARLEGDAHRAEDHLHDGLDVGWPAGHHPFVCDTLDALAAVTADQGRLEEAVRLLGAAQRAREAIGYVRHPVLRPMHEADTTALRDQLGADAFASAWADGSTMALADAVAYARRGRGQRKRPTHGWDSLTPTELQVVDLVAEGLTNPQIGTRLFVSPRTVKAHLAHVFVKLGVSTRAELAAAAIHRRAAGKA